MKYYWDIYYPNCDQEREQYLSISHYNNYQKVKIIYVKNTISLK